MEIPKTIHKLLTNLLDGANHFLAKGEELEPLLFLFNIVDNEPRRIDILRIGPLMENDMSKEFLAAMMNAILQENSADLLVMLSEAWVVKLPMEEYSKEEATRIRPKDHPDRQECVLFNVMTKTKQIIAEALITRNKDGTATAGKLEILPEGGEGTLIRDEEDAPRIH